MGGATGAGGCALLSLHVWLVRYEGRTKLIDTGGGSEKTRWKPTVIEHLRNPFLKPLSAAGVEPKDVGHSHSTLPLTGHVTTTSSRFDPRFT